ncbi:tail terminator [Arthrobacter phage Whytu]|uniref:Tail terminator n=1 Tax=Arthrobacter phage Whytu TaxID=2713260 RepID=A0A6G8R2Q0_9CAUD|nr:tail terminator [Arthrobacter phage Whytu]QIN94474.1 tail terminator [Arthrobacter phage Whytu]
MSLRSDLAATLKTELGSGFAVLSSKRAIDNTSIPVVMVHRKTVTPGPERKRLSTDVEVLVLVAETYGDGAEDKADEALDDVLRVLERIEDPIVWSRAERDNFEGGFVGYAVTLEATTDNYLLPGRE